MLDCDLQCAMAALDDYLLGSDQAGRLGFGLMSGQLETVPVHEPRCMPVVAVVSTEKRSVGLLSLTPRLGGSQQGA